MSGWLKTLLIEALLNHFKRPAILIIEIEQRPGVVIKLLTLLQSQNVDSHDWFSELLNFIRRAINTPWFVDIFANNQEAELAIIKILHLNNSEDIAQHIYSKSVREFDLTTVPLGYVNDLRWYAKVNGDDELIQALGQYMS